MIKKFNYQVPENGYPEWNNNPEIVSINSNNQHSDFYLTKTYSRLGEELKKSQIDIFH